MADLYEKIDDDAKLKATVRAETQYANNSDELPDSDLDEIMKQAKRKVFLDTGSKAWYTDEGLGFALAAYTCMRAKSAVENIPIAGYTIGDEQVQTRQADPDDSQQIQGWADDVRTGLNASDVIQSSGLQVSNTSGYIGEDHVNTSATSSENT